MAVLVLHSGVPEADAHYDGDWEYWDDYQRVNMGAEFSFGDAACVGTHEGEHYYFVTPRTPAATACKITDGSPPTLDTYVKAGLSGIGSDNAYDATNNKVYVLWGDQGTVMITRMDVATWTEDGTATLTGYYDGALPSLAVHPDGTRLYVVTYGGTDEHPTQLLKVTNLSSWPTPTVAEALRFYTGNRATGHCVRIDPTNTDALYCSGIGSWRARVNISTTPMALVWETTARPHGWAFNSYNLAFHDDIDFTADHVYLIGSYNAAPSTQKRMVPGAIKVNKSNGEILDSYGDDAVYTNTLDGVGVAVNRTTNEVMATQGRGMALPVWTLADHKVRQRNSPDGTNPDDLQWSDDGDAIWSLAALQSWLHHDTYVTRWDKIDGPMGLGRIRTQLDAWASFTIGDAHDAANDGVYAGLAYGLLDGYAFAIDHCSIITLTEDGTTDTWRARLQHVRGTGALQLAFPDGARINVNQQTAGGWHFAELRYDKDDNRYRVYLDNGALALDVSRGTAFDAGQTVFGPWDASGADTERLSIHTAYDIQLDDEEYDGARWGEITTCYGYTVGANSAYQEWDSEPDTNPLNRNQSQSINDIPDFLTPDPSVYDAWYIESDGDSATAQWSIFLQQRYSDQMPIMRAVHIGVRAKAQAGAGSFNIGWNGEAGGTPNDDWILKPITPTGAFAHYGATFYTQPDGTFPLIAHTDGYFALQQNALAGVDARVTQVVVSMIASKYPALSFTATRVDDTTALDITSRGYAARGIFTPTSQGTSTLDIPARGFAARDIIAQQRVVVTPAYIIVTGAVATLTANVSVTPTVAAIAITPAVPVPAESVLATVAHVVVAGAVAMLRAETTLTATAGAIAMAGAVAISTAETSLVATTGEITVEGAAAVATTTVEATATAGEIAVTGAVAAATTAVNAQATAAAIALTGGVALGILRTPLLATSGEIAVVGAVAIVTTAVEAEATPGAVVVSGAVATGEREEVGLVAEATAGEVSIAGAVAVATTAVSAPATAGEIILAGAVAIGALRTSVTVMPGAVVMSGAVAAIATAVTAQATTATVAVTGAVAVGSMEEVGLVGAATAGVITVAGAVAVATTAATAQATAAALMVTGAIALLSVEAEPQTAEATIAALAISGAVATERTAFSGVATAGQIAVTGAVATAETGVPEVIALATAAAIAFGGAVATPAVGPVTVVAITLRLEISGAVAVLGLPIPVIDLSAAYVPRIDLQGVTTSSTIAFNAEYIPEGDLQGRFG